LENIPAATQSFHQENARRHAAREEIYGGSLIFQRQALRRDDGQIAVESALVAIDGLIERALCSRDRASCVLASWSKTRRSERESSTSWNAVRNGLLVRRNRTSYAALARSEIARRRPASNTVSTADAPTDQSALGPASHEVN